MRTTLSNLAAVAMVITTVGAVYPAFALDDSATLRCEASVKKSEARFFGCAARCQERADFRAAAGVGYDPRCNDRCEGQYDDTVSRLNCAVSPERIAAPDTTGMDAPTLGCYATARTVEAKLLRCHAGCAETVELAARRGVVIDPQSCDDGCMENGVAAIAGAQGDCVLED